MLRVPPLQFTLALRVLKPWTPFSELPDTTQARLADSLQALPPRPGHKLYDYTALPLGVALVDFGDQRLLSLDERQEPFTLQPLGVGAMVGQEGLLRGVAGQAVADALPPSQLWLMPQQAFLEAVAGDEALLRPLAQPNLEELYAVAAASPSPRTPERLVLRDWVSNQLTEAADRQQVPLMPPGEHSLGADWGPWLLSSNNVAGFSPGEELMELDGRYATLYHQQEVA